MTNHVKAMDIMKERFGKDSLIAVATTSNDIMYNRIVDAYFEDGAFYTTTNLHSDKIKQIEKNNKVAVAAVNWFTGHGIATNLGHIFNPENSEIASKLKSAFLWFDNVILENDTHTCILKIELTEGLLIENHGEFRYKINFANNNTVVSENFDEFK